MTEHATEAAFLEKLAQHRGTLAKVGGTYCRNAASREDLMQEIVVQLWRSFPRYDGRAAFSTWMYRIALNVAISFYRREARRAHTFEPRDPVRFDTNAQQHQGDTNDALASVLAHIDRLNELDRAVMILYLDDKSYAEIAAILGISETNVATKIGRIKQRLRRDVTAQPSDSTGGTDGTR